MNYIAALVAGFCTFAITSCGEGMPSSELDAAPDASGLAPVANPARGIAETRVQLNPDTLAASATIAFEPSPMPGATLEIGDIEITKVEDTANQAVAWLDRGDRLDVALAASDSPQTLVVHYTLKKHSMSDGFNFSAAAGYTLTWPYHCGNLFPCHSDPADGTAFAIAVDNPANGKTVIAPTGVVAEAPSYQLAFAIGDYTTLELGTTNAGTKLVVSHLPNRATQARNGTANLVKAFEWLESTIGPYRFGNVAGTVEVNWGAGAFGGMEHHPLWHVGSSALASEEVNVHEAAHGWYGDGIRIACWEDFVLSEGTVTYLAGRALEVVAPTVGAAVWDDYAEELAGISPTAPVWPTGCNQIDIIKDELFSNAPYMRGAFFYRALALKVGAAKVDEVLATFYATHAGKAATMDQMLQTIQTVSGYDATACANAWLRSPTIPAIGACP